MARLAASSAIMSEVNESFTPDCFTKNFCDSVGGAAESRVRLSEDSQ